MKRSILSLSFYLLAMTLIGQVYVPGTHNDWDLDAGNEAALKTNLGGSQTFYGITIQPSVDGEFKVVLDTWATNWGGGYWITSYNQRWTPASGGANAVWKDSPNTYVHLCIEDPNDYSGTNLPVGIMTLSASPVNISSVSQAGFLEGMTFYASASGQNISIDLSSAKSAEENIYLRYTADNWTTDNFVAATGSGTSYSATIPVQSRNGCQLLCVLNHIDLEQWK